MSRSLASAVSGLRAHQLMLDVVGNNIANVNTPGYKASRVDFSDILSQTLQGATAPSATSGGVNPRQVGPGVAVGSVTPQFTQGDMQITNRPTDMAIQGQGFFILSNGTTNYFTRAGSFQLDANGNLVDAVTGFKVQGITGDIQIVAGTATSPVRSSAATFKGNLDSGAATGATYTSTYSIVDSLGSSHSLTLTFSKSASAGTWTFASSSSDGGMSISGTNPGSGTITFDATGNITGGSIGTISLNFTNGASSAQTITLDFASGTNTSPVSGFASSSSVALRTQNGAASGILQGFTVSADGKITGLYSNGATTTLATLKLASFSNSAGLSREGSNLFRDSANSGVPATGTPGTGDRGKVTSGTLEGSNVDLAEEFTKLIVAQRGFQANARVITSTDEVLQEAVNLKR